LVLDVPAPWQAEHLSPLLLTILWQPSLGGNAGALEPWQLEHAIADFSTVPLMCLVASFQVELDPLNFEMTSPWQFSQAVDVVCVPPGGVVWQDLPQASWLPSTLFHTGV
jgi:hypothetical protein